VELDTEVKGLQSPNYLRQLLEVMVKERHHDLEGMASKVDSAIANYSENLFDIFVHDDILENISKKK
jgi:hypothetical protein